MLGSRVVDGCVDADVTVQAFADFFSSCYSCNSVKQQEQFC